MPRRARPLEIPLSSEHLRKLRVKAGETSQILRSADEFYDLVKNAVPSIGCKPDLLRYLKANQGKMVAVVPANSDYIFQFVRND